MTSPSNLQERFKIAQSVILEAGALANDYFKKLSSLTIKSKGAHDLVSEADLNTEVLIRERFAKSFPEDAFFGEETGATSIETARGVWVVDPIDGTQPFLTGLPNWCISIAYVLDGSVIALLSLPEKSRGAGQIGIWYRDCGVAAISADK